MRPLILLSLFAVFTLSFRSFADPYSEEERLAGFTQHQRRKKEFNEKRQEGADEIKKKRKAWEDQLQASVDDYKAFKARQATALDESSPEYKEDLKRKKKFAEELDEARRNYIKERDLKNAQKKSRVHLTEEEELGLNEPVDRVDVRKRALYGGGPTKLSNMFPGRGRPRGRGGSTDFSPPAPDLSGAPPPPPEFYEPEIPPPPPPPPPPMDFEEQPIPPPVFEDPEF